MSRSPLVSTEWLAEHLDDPNVVIAHVKYEPDIDDYSEGHIPGAHFWYWKDFFWHDTDRQFLEPEMVAERLGSWGIDENTTLVMFSGRNQYAIYGWWAFHVMAGHPDVRILDGHHEKWKLEGRPLTTEIPEVTPVEYTVQRDARDDSSRVTREDVRDNLGKPGRVLVDARFDSEYFGRRVKPGAGFDFGAERYGRIPGAKHIAASKFFNEDDATIKSAAELEELFRDVGAAPDQADEVVAYCRLSHRASLVYFCATQVLGWDHVRVYDGSWTEWGSAVGFPVEIDSPHTENDG